MSVTGKKFEVAFSLSPSQIGVHHKIVKGPGELDLSYAYMRKGHPIEITIQGIGVVKLELTMLRPEDGSRKKWLIDGWVQPQIDGESPQYYYDGYYDITTRTGWIKFRTLSF